MKTCTLFLFFSNSNHQLAYFILDHSNYWSFCPFWCCMLFQWYIATIDPWLPMGFSYLPRVFGKSNDQIWSELKAF